MHEERRSVNDLAGSQSGDHHARDAAGRDIVHSGADATAVLDFLRAYVFDADQRRETSIKALHHELQHQRGDLGIISDALRSLRDRADADARERKERQGDLDAQLGEFTEALQSQADDLTVARRWLAVLTLALIVAAVIIGGLVWREAAALALRATFDALALSR